jgi:alpha-methylacyl-CoA racemase
MVLADLGAEVIRFDQPGQVGTRNRAGYDVLMRSRKRIALDLKHPDGLATALRLIESADGLIEGFRPGVMERLGLGPDVCLARNPKLVFGRMTGWGQDGPLASAAGHDINYIALTGALHAIGPRDGVPSPPLNLVGDFGGGGMFLALGIVAAILEARTSGKGQVVDAAMVDGASILMASYHGGLAAGGIVEERGANTLDGGAHYYGAYETKDGKFVSVGSIEPQFYELLLKHSGLGAAGELPRQNDKGAWPSLKERLAAIFKTKTRDEWCAIMEGTDVCFAPALTVTEAYEHPHNRARGTFVEVEGVRQPAPAPRFSRTPGTIEGGAAVPGAHSEAILAGLGLSAVEIGRLRESGAVVQA